MNAKIVVGVTDTSVGHRAVEWAAQRAVQRGCDLELLSVVRGAEAPGEDEVLYAAKSASQRFLDREAQFALSLGVTKVETSIGRGKPVNRLVEASEHASLLVIGSDYRGPDHGPARGAHGVRVVAGSQCPVVVVPDVDLGERRGVVVGVDGSEISLAAVRFAAAEADRSNEPLIALSVWTPLEVPRNPMVYPEQYLSNIEKITKETLAMSLAGVRQDYPGLEIEQRVARGYPSAVINETAHSARLVVLGTHGRGRVARFLLGSISHEVLARLATVTAIVR